MSVFAWQAIDASGNRKKGEIESDSERSARKQLKQQGLIVRKLIWIKKDKPQSEGMHKQHLNAMETTLLLQQLSTLTSAGMPISDALSAIAEGMEAKRAKRAVLFLHQQVLEGISLADALRAIGMDQLVCNMVAAGEETGALEAVASRLSDLLEKRQQMSQELLSAILYPMIILCFGLLVMLVLLTWVVPQIVAVFERTGGALPALTQWMIIISSILREYGLLLLLLFAVIGIGISFSMRMESVRNKRDIWLLRLPVISGLLSKIEMARFSRTLGMLLSGGVPSLAAMHIANQSFILLPFQRIGNQARELLREGANLSDAFRQKEVPHLAIQLIAVGEKSGNLDQMLLRIANQYEQEISRNLKRMLTIVEPALMLVMAVMVGMMAIAILLPIVEMNSLVR